jgi:hypothetical protein
VFVGGQLKHEIIRESIEIAFDSLIQRSYLNPVEIG